MRSPCTDREAALLSVRTDNETLVWIYTFGKKADITRANISRSIVFDDQNINYLQKKQL